MKTLKNLEKYKFYRKMFQIKIVGLKKIYLKMQFVLYNYIIFLKSNCIFFTSIDSSHYFVHKSEI